MNYTSSKDKSFPVCAPFKVVKHFKSFKLWWLIIVVTLIGPVCDALLKESTADMRFKYFINTGSLYYSVITLIFSFVVTNAIDMLFEKMHDDGLLEFFHYQIISFIISVLLLVILLFLYTLYRENAYLQIFLSIFGYVFSFYLYCISCMPRVRIELQEYTLNYDELVKNNAKNMDEDKNTSSDGMKI